MEPFLKAKADLTKLRVFSTYILFAVVLSLLPYISASVNAQEKSSILVVLSKEGKIYREVLQGIEKGLEEAGVKGITVESVVINKNNSIPKPTVLGQRFDLVVGVGVKATEIALRENNLAPVLSLLVPRITVQKIEEEQSRIKGNSEKKIFSAIYLDQPPERQFQVIKRMLPSVKKIGILLGDSGLSKLFRLKTTANKLGLQLNVSVLRDTDHTAKRLNALAERSDAILAIYDPVITNGQTARWLLFSAYQYQVPVIGFSNSFVQAGALASIYSTPEMIGRQACEAISSMKKSGKWSTNKRWHPEYFTIELNSRLVRSLKMKDINVADIGKHIKGFTEK